MQPPTAAAAESPLGQLIRQLVRQASDLDSSWPDDARHAVVLARHLQNRAQELQTPQEKRQQAELDRMIQNPHDRITLTQLTDQAFRAQAPQRAVDQLVHILDVQGIPRFFTPVDRVLLRGFQSFGAYLPGVAVPLVKDKMHHETANVILPAEYDLLAEHLRNRRQAGVRMNVNYLGEALLGEEEAQNRLRGYLQALQLPEIEVISVKISTIYSQIAPLAREQTIATLSDRLELLFRAAAKATFTRHDGTQVPKFVYLDMEEYRDMSLTAEAFMRTLDRPGLQHAAAGIALQAYIPDSFRTQQALLAWSRARVGQGGAPLTMRLVKGANMEMERFEASLHGWPQAPFKEKIDTDANFRRMLQLAMDPNHLPSARVGIASHNLFELAYGLVLTQARDAWGQVQFEMLEGMANHQRRALFELCSQLLLYAPACRKADFIHAIGYLVRRLDENTGPDNFLRHAFRIRVGSEDWRRLEQQFLAAFTRIPQLTDQPRRRQDRRQPPCQPRAGSHWTEFRNEADTDFAQLQNHEWACSILDAWRDRHSEAATVIPLVVAGQAVTEDRRLLESRDPSRPDCVVARYLQANAQDIETAVACAHDDPAAWRQWPTSERRTVLRDVAQRLRERRGDMMGAALADGGKLLTESDPEVSEAIDFVEFYSLAADDFASLPGLVARPRGVVVVVSPWNFPLAIPCGGIAAALAAGNTVILKPASDTVLPAYELCRCFWDGGVPPTALQLIPCSGRGEGQQLVSHPQVESVILTGGTDTALTMLSHHPRLRLLAETGGKNATIVTALADRDQAIKNVLHSAFSHSGQKCSATSLLVLESEVFHDPKFKHALCDAVSSLTVGSAWDLATRLGPLIRVPSGVLETALKELEPGESWAVMPRRHPQNPQLYSPAVKWNVQPGSFTHRTEFFGPVLGVMQAAHLSEAIDLVNQTGYGLTSGLESLDDREQGLWQSRIRAGNLYINRGTTGAIVLRQPFGGMEKSAFGPGIKAGGPNYVAQLMHFQDAQDAAATARHGTTPVNEPLLRDLLRKLESAGAARISPDDCALIREGVLSQEAAFQQEFGREHDHFRLLGQDNFRRYLPVAETRVRVHADDAPWELLLRVSAARIAGCRTVVSYPPGWDATAAGRLVRWLDHATDTWAAAIEFVEESDAQLAQRMRERPRTRLRFAGPQRVPLDVRRAAVEAGVHVADEPVLRCGRIELLWYLEEQSLSDNYHRYGNLGGRADEVRCEPD